MTTPKTLRQKRDELLRDARDNPGSEAGEMLGAIVLAGISRLESEQEAELEMNETRQLFESFRQQNPKPGSETASKTVIDGLWEREQKLEDVMQATAEAQAAIAAGQPLDALAVCNRIAEIVGLRKPESQPEAGDKAIWPA